jgi:hypothetical protein
MLSGPLTVFEGISESVTCTLKLEVPAEAGTPDMAPLAFRLRPNGKVPAAIDQEYGVTPPVAASVWLYDAPAVPPGREVVVTCSGGPAAIAMLSTSFAVLAGLSESVTATVKFAVPVWMGVPEIDAALAFNVTPAGRFPLLTDHV